MRTLVLSFDQLSATWLGCYGELKYPTLHFDQMADSGTVMERCYLSPAAGNTIDAWLRSRDGRPVQVHEGSITSLDADLESILSASPENSVDVTSVLRVSCGPVTRSLLRQAFESSLPGRWEARRRELESALAAQPHFIPPTVIDQLVSQLPEWEQGTIRSACRAITADGILGRVLAKLSISPHACRLVVTSDCGDPGADPSGADSWQQSVSESATHLPLLALNPAQPGPRRVHSQIPVMSGLDWLAGSATDQPIPQTPVIECVSPAARSLRSRDWLLIERLNATAQGDESEVRLFRLPEDPWGLRNVAGEHFDLIDHYRATGQLPAH